MKNKFKNNGKLYVVSDLSGLSDQFSEGPQQAPTKIAISQTGVYTPAFGDPREINEQMFDKMIENFEADTLKTKPSVYYGHWDVKRAAAGEIKELFKAYNDTLSKTILYARVEWTPQGKRAILEKEYKYISAEFAYDFKRAMDKEGNVNSYGAVLTGVALTNEPAVYDIPQIVFSGNKNFLAQFQNMGFNKNNDDDNNPEGEDKMEELLRLMAVKTEAEAKEKFSKLTEKMKELEKADFSAQIKSKDEAIKTLKEEIETIKKDHFSKEKESFLKVVFEEGKIDKEKYDKAMNYDKDQFAVFKDIIGDSASVLPKPEGTAKQKGKEENPDKSFAEFAKGFDPDTINEEAE